MIQTRQNECKSETRHQDECETNTNDNLSQENRLRRCETKINQRNRLRRFEVWTIIIFLLLSCTDDVKNHFRYSSHVFTWERDDVWIKQTNKQINITFVSRFFVYDNLYDNLTFRTIQYCFAFLFMIIFMIILYNMFFNASFCREKKSMIYFLLIFISSKESERFDVILLLEILQSSMWSYQISSFDDSMITTFAQKNEKSISISKSSMKLRSWFCEITRTCLRNLKNIILTKIS
jgi:hypothetical protein